MVALFAALSWQCEIVFLRDGDCIKISSVHLLSPSWLNRARTMAVVPGIFVSTADIAASTLTSTKIDKAQEIISMQKITVKRFIYITCDR